VKDKSQAFGCLGMMTVAWLLFVVLLVPRSKPEDKDLAGSSGARDLVYKQFSERLTDADIRIEQRDGLNLEVWLSRSSFESLPYLGRKEFLDSVGKDWCDQPSRWSVTNFLPSITVRDAQNGKNLAVHHCLFSRSDLDPN
jgi:hypothetical protein